MITHVLDTISGAQNVALRIDFVSGTDRDLNLASTSAGASPYYRTWDSGFFQETNLVDATVRLWINGTAGPSVTLRNADLLMYCR